jgi:hypothetical protein
MQQMFLKLHDIEDSEKKDFILETLRREFRDVVIEARKVSERFNMLGSHVNVVGTNKEEIKVPIPFKLVGLHETLEKNFDWIVPKNPFDESSELIRLKRIYNFLCSMLVYTPFALCFVTLRGIFMHFPELSY